MFFLTIETTYSNALDSKEVLKSVEQSYPMIIEAKLKEKMARMDLRSRKGAFDLNLEGETDIRLSGYYDSKSYSAKLVKPFRSLNSKVYLGYRIQEGEVPVYEGKSETLDNGEYLFGLELSLLRDRYMHTKMFKEVLAQLKVTESSNKLETVRMNIKHDALVVYWDWVATGKIYQIYRDLLTAAEQRENGLKRRHQRGDLAKIRIVENRQYITERRSQKVKAFQKFQNRSQELSLFYRNAQGQPLVMGEESLPNISWSKFSTNLEKDLFLDEEKLLNNPKFQNFENQHQQIERAVDYNKNLLLPKLDLKFESSRDQGDGPSTLVGTENRVMLSLEIPIERNLGRGAVQREKTKAKIVRNTESFQQEVAKIKSETLKNKIVANKEIIKNAIDEVGFAEKLMKAENRLFRNGSSDYFVLNLREQSLAKAKIKKLESFFNYKRSVVEINNLYWNL